MNFSYQECKLTCIGDNLKQNEIGDFQLSGEYLCTCIVGTTTQNLLGEFQLSRMHIDMHSWDLTTKSFRRFSAIKNTYEHALMGLHRKIFSAICSDQEYLWISIGGILTQNLFGDFQLVKNTFWHALVGPEHEILRRVSAIKNTYCFPLVGP